MEERVWHKFYAPPVPPSIDYERITLVEAMERTIKTYPDNIALDLMGGTMTYREFSDLVNQFATALADLGIRKGDKVALVLPNLPQMVIATYSIWKIGAIVVMNNPLYTERELEYQFSDSGCKMAIAMDLLVPRMLSLKQKTKIENIIACHIRTYLPFPLKQLFPIVKKAMHRKTIPGEGVIDFIDLVKKYPPKPPNVKVDFDELAALLYTGGTTGVSKGVMLSHANLSINVQQAKALLYNMEDGNETVIGSLPFFHAAGFTFGMNQCLYRGFKHVLIPRPDDDALINAIKKHRPAVFGAVPTMYVGILNHPKLPPKEDLSFIKGSISGAAPLALDTLKHWEERVGAQIIEVYGMTEMSPVSHANPWGGKTKPGSVGVPYPDTDCKIVDVETGEKEMPPGKPGEILLKGPQMMMGYYQKPEETETALRGGWFHTGDVGSMDEEGYLYLVDRTKDMIIAGGYNIYPREIDEILFEHPKIKEACAIGVPDAYRGETVKAFIVVKEGETLTEEDIIAYCRENLAAYKVPKIIEFMDDLPKSAIGKIMRKELRKMEEERQKK